MAWVLVHSANLPIELTNGNDGQGRAWFAKASRRQKIESALLAAGHKRTPFTGRVVVRVTRMLGKGQRLWDSSSVGRGNYKEIEDALVSLGWFVDDGPEWISETRYRQMTRNESGQETSSTLIEVFSQKEDT